MVAYLILVRCSGSADSAFAVAMSQSKRPIPKNEYTHHCHLCPKAFWTLGSLRTHFAQSHPDQCFHLLTERQQRKLKKQNRSIAVPKESEVPPGRPRRRRPVARLRLFPHKRASGEWYREHKKKAPPDAIRRCRGCGKPAVQGHDYCFSCA